MYSCSLSCFRGCCRDALCKGPQLLTWHVHAVLVQPGKRGTIMAVAAAALGHDIPVSALPAALGLPAPPAQSAVLTARLEEFWVAGPPLLLLGTQHLPAIMEPVGANSARQATGLLGTPIHHCGPLGQSHLRPSCSHDGKRPLATSCRHPAAQHSQPALPRCCASLEVPRHVCKCLRMSEGPPFQPRNDQWRSHGEFCRREAFPAGGEHNGEHQDKGWEPKQATGVSATPAAGRPKDSPCLAFASLLDIGILRSGGPRRLLHAGTNCMRPVRLLCTPHHVPEPGSMG